MGKKVNPSISVAITKDFETVARELEEFCNEYLIDRNEFIRRAIKEKLQSFKSKLVKAEKTITALKPASSYLVKEEKAEKSFSLFKELVSSGVMGLCLTRQNPEEIKEKYNLSNIVWLSRSSEANIESIAPTELGRIAHLINDFIKKHEGSAVLIDGLEYLITHNDFNMVLRFINDLTENITLANSRLILPINPITLTEKELALFERNMNIIEGVKEVGSHD